MQSELSGRLKIVGMAALLSMFLTGCAAIPDMGALKMPRFDFTSFSLSPQKKAPIVTSALQGDWWAQYNDPQLDNLMVAALAQSPSLAEATARLAKADAEAQVAGAARLPSINADGSYAKQRQSYNNGTPANAIQKGFNDSVRAAVNFDYELDFWGKNKNAVAAATSDAQAAALDSAQARIVLTTSIAAAYADYARLQAELDAANDTLDVRSKTASLFDERLKNGLENEGGVEQANANKAGAEAEVAALEEQVALSKNALAALVGATPDKAAQITAPKISNIHSFGVPETIPSDLLGRRPDLMAARLKLEAAADRIKVARAGFYPDINLTAYLGHQSVDLGTFMKSGSLIGSFGPAIHLPIFEGGALRGAYRGARADYDIALAQYDAAVIEALHQTADAITSLKALDVRTKKTKAARDAAERAYNVANDRYRGGLSTFLEVLTAEDTLITNRRAMADIRARGFALDVALIKALGGGYQPNTQNQ